jgi:hypothetical protein
MQSNGRRTIKPTIAFVGGVVAALLFATFFISKPCMDPAWARHIRVQADIRTLRSLLDGYKARTGHTRAPLKV